MLRSDLHIDSFSFPVRGRVRYQGRVLTKYDLAYYIDMLYPYIHATIIYDAFSYNELADMLKKQLLKK